MLAEVSLEDKIDIGEVLEILMRNFDYLLFRITLGEEEELEIVGKIDRNQRLLDIDCSLDFSKKKICNVPLETMYRAARHIYFGIEKATARHNFYGLPKRSIKAIVLSPYIPKDFENTVYTVQVTYPGGPIIEIKVLEKYFSNELRKISKISVNIGAYRRLGREPNFKETEKSIWEAIKRDSEYSYTKNRYFTSIVA